MKPTNLIIIFSVIIILGIIYLIYKSNKKEKIKLAAINSGIPVSTATNIANSSDSKRAMLSLGVPESVATLISLGTGVQNAEAYKCTHTDGTVKDGPCTTVDANNGWVTSSK